MFKRRLLSKLRGKSSQHKRSHFQLTLVLVLITFAFIFQGCGPTPVPIETPRNLSTALEVFDPPASTCSPTEPPFSCEVRSPDRLLVTVDVSNLKTPQSVAVELKSLSDSDKEMVLMAKSDFEITRLVAYFEIIDINTGKTISEFDSDFLEIRIEFTADQWKEWTEESGLEHPRLAYLVKKGDQWESAWKEFTKENIVKVTPPGTGDNPGEIIIQMETWGDPLIGGT